MGSSPDIALKVEVLPAPFAPIKVTISPFFTSKERSFNAWIPP